VAQAMNYLRSLDELGAGLSKTYENELGQKYDMRRVFATVVIGHPKHANKTDNPTVVAQTLRSYNAHLSRIEVVTYDQLVDSAERALVFEEHAKQAQRSARDSAANRRREHISDDPWRSDSWDEEHDS
jgi:hypothetical protein